MKLPASEFFSRVNKLISCHVLRRDILTYRDIHNKALAGVHVSYQAPELAIQTAKGVLNHGSSTAVDHIVVFLSAG